MTHSTLAATYGRLQAYLGNSGWIVSERLIRLGLEFLSLVLLARYLGPQTYGSLAYALSLTALFGGAGHMGLQGMVVRDIVKNVDRRAETVGTAVTLKFLGMTGGYALLCLYALIVEEVGSVDFYLIIICGAALLFRPLDVVDFWFQAFVQARFVSMARIVAIVISTALKLTLIFAGVDVVYIAATYILEAMIAALMLLLFLRLKSDLRISHWRLNLALARDMLKQGWVIYLGSIFAMVYLKVDQIMLRWFSGAEDVGVYAIAAQLSEALYFLPAAVVASFFPALIALHERDKELFKHRFQQLLDALFLLGVAVAVVMTVAGTWVIELFFGSQYAASGSILVIHVWAALFIFMRSAFSRWILIEDALHFSLFTQGLGALINILLNLLLIPRFGGIGAAYATVMAYAVASFFALLFSPRTRPVFWQMATAMLAPIRYPLRLAKR